jgi:hypothetical protein
MKVIEEKKTVLITTGGSILTDEGNAVYDKLKDIFSSLNTSLYNLIIDSSDFRIVAEENIELLKYILNLYDSTPFKKKIFILPKSEITNMQTHNLANASLSHSIIRVDSYEEAISLIK